MKSCIIEYQTEATVLNLGFFIKRCESLSWLTKVLHGSSVVECLTHDHEVPGSNTTGC